MDQEKYEATRNKNHTIAAKMAGLLMIVKNDRNLPDWVTDHAKRLHDEYEANAAEAGAAIEA